MERTEVCELTFYRLSADKEVRRVLRSLFDWQTTWQLQLTRLAGMIGEPGQQRHLNNSPRGQKYPDPNPLNGAPAPRESPLE